jgi:hypothetical protein
MWYCVQTDDIVDAVEPVDARGSHVSLLPNKSLVEKWRSVAVPELIGGCLQLDENCAPVTNQSRTAVSAHCDARVAMTKILQAVATRVPVATTHSERVSSQVRKDCRTCLKTRRCICPFRRAALPRRDSARPHLLAQAHPSDDPIGHNHFLASHP